MIFAKIKKGKTKITITSTLIDTLSLLAAISKCTSERLSVEKNITEEEAEIIVAESIAEGMKKCSKQN